MKKTKWIRLTGMMLAVVVLMAGPFGGAALAADDETYREFKPPREIPSTPQWEQQEVTCQSGDNTLRGTLTVPKEHDDQIPVAILLHGLNTDRSWCDDIASIPADNGIASVRRFLDFDGNGAGRRRRIGGYDHFL